MSFTSSSYYEEIEPRGIDDDDQQHLLSTSTLRNVASKPLGRSQIAENIASHERNAGAPSPAKEATYTVNQLPRPSDMLSNKYITWGVGWRLPLTMISFFLAGVLAVFGHHYYYSRLDGTTAGNTTAQQMVLWIGTGFTFLTLFLLNTGNGIAFTQYVWHLVKLYGFTIKDLDKLFSVTLDITAFFSLSLWRRAGTAMFLAFLLWCLALTTVVPPGTIAVIPGGLSKLSKRFTIQTFNWTNIIRGQTDCGILICESGENFEIAYPNPITLKLASQAAEGVNVLPLPAPAWNSSFNTTFFGPALSCGQATASQQASFDFYNEVAYQDSGILTGPQYLDGKHNTIQNLLYYSAFSPQLYGDISVSAPVPGISDSYNNWNASLPPPYYDNFNEDIAELWVQLADKSIVCSLYNASYTVGFDYPNGVQNITHRHVKLLNQWTVNIGFPEGGSNYLGVMASLVPMLYGNVTILSYDCHIGGHDTTCYFLSDISSKVLSSGIGACKEFTHSFWQSHVANGTLQSEQPDGSFLAFSSWECRNHTVALAIEDLFANYTISLLATNLSNFFSQPVTVHGIVYNTINVYSYDAKSLLASYGAAVGVSLLVISFGIFSLWKNGIGHDASFSALMATTRNPELDMLTKGQSLGPLEESLERTKLKFGAVAQSSEYGTRRAAFGVDKSVVSLKIGEKYI